MSKTTLPRTGSVSSAEGRLVVVQLGMYVLYGIRF